MLKNHASVNGGLSAPGACSPRAFRRCVAWALLQLMAALAVAVPAAAASLQEVMQFGNNPSKARMFIYVPDKLAATPPILVAIHYCGGNANAFFTGTGYKAQADQRGFIVIYPQTTSTDGCFDVHSDATLKHGGGGDSASIVSMVQYAIMKHAANASRVYVTGTSSGAMMTNVLLGAYPDVFRAGASFAGVPYACFAGAGGWNSACADGQTTKTAQQWGDLVRAGYPGYTGPRPRVQLWHGDRDDTLDFHNFGEAIKQWTNVLGVSEMPTSTEKNVPQSGWTRTRYADAGGVVRVEAVLEAGATHNLTVPAAEVIRFFGLDAAADPDGAAPSGGGAAGAPAAAGSGGPAANAGAGGAMTAAAGSGGAGDQAKRPAPPRGDAGAAAPRPAGTGAMGAAGAAGMSGAAGAAGSRPGASAGAAAVSGAAGNLSPMPTAGAAGGAPVAGDDGAEPASKPDSGCSVRGAGRQSRGVAWAFALIGLGFSAIRVRRRRRACGGRLLSSNTSA